MSLFGNKRPEPAMNYSHVEQQTPPTPPEPDAAMVIQAMLNKVLANQQTIVKNQQIIYSEIAKLASAQEELEEKNEEETPLPAIETRPRGRPAARKK